MRGKEASHTGLSAPRAKMYGENQIIHFVVVQDHTAIFVAENWLD